MLKMNKDHRSAGLRWSLLLSGSSLGGYGSSLGFICSCFVFPITSPITAGVAADVFVNVYCTRWLMRRTSSLCNYDGLETRVLHWKSTLLSVSSAAPKRGEKRASHVMILAFNFELFQRVPRHLSRCMFGLSGLACVWGLSDGPMPWPLISTTIDCWASFALGPQSKVWCFGLGLTWQKKQASTPSKYYQHESLFIIILYYSIRNPNKFNKQNIDK